ncbi:hypothetical protein FGO68_gene6988 [Halteria grandinella]|uniref:Uncharacterized protein n=1 Tax=Halteria grandinella TaxID=5974 RepID=A0A8J8NGE2_HALGN|nr:hypothetical protein FGO68_gene6988 [Halteria grandinella]
MQLQLNPSLLMKDAYYNLELSSTFLKWTANKSLQGQIIQNGNIQESSSTTNQKQTNSLTVVKLNTIKLSKLNGHLSISLRNALTNSLTQTYIRILIMLKYCMNHSLSGPSIFFKIRELMLLTIIKNLVGWILTVTSALKMQTLIRKAQTLTALTWQCLRQITAEVSLNWKQKSTLASIKNQQQRSCHCKNLKLAYQTVLQYQISLRRAKTLFVHQHAVTLLIYLH